jgi:hypothetical protein
MPVGSVRVYVTIHLVSVYHLTLAKQPSEMVHGHLTHVPTK